MGADHLMAKKMDQVLHQAASKVRETPSETLDPGEHREDAPKEEDEIAV